MHACGHDTCFMCRIYVCVMNTSMKMKCCARASCTQGRALLQSRSPRSGTSPVIKTQSSGRCSIKGLAGNSYLLTWFNLHLSFKTALNVLSSTFNPLSQSSSSPVSVLGCCLFDNKLWGEPQGMWTPPSSISGVHSVVCYELRDSDSEVYEWQIKLGGGGRVGGVVPIFILGYRKDLACV